MNQGSVFLSQSFTLWLILVSLPITGQAGVGQSKLDPSYTILVGSPDMPSEVQLEEPHGLPLQPSTPSRVPPSTSPTLEERSIWANIKNRNWADLTSYLDTRQLLKEKVAYFAALQGSLEGLRWSLENGFPIEPVEGFLPVDEFIPEFFAQPTWTPRPSLRVVDYPSSYLDSSADSEFSPFVRVAIRTPTLFWSRLNPLVGAVLKGHFEIVRFLLENYSTQTLLKHAEGVWLFPQSESQDQSILNLKDFFKKGSERPMRDPNEVGQTLHWLLTFYGQRELASKVHPERELVNAPSPVEDDGNRMVDFERGKEGEAFCYGSGPSFRPCSLSPIEAFQDLEHLSWVYEIGDQEEAFVEAYEVLNKRLLSGNSTKDSQGFSLLHRLAYTGQLEILKKLNSRGWSEGAAWKALEEVTGTNNVVYGFERIYIGRTPLEIALLRKKKKFAQYLLEMINAQPGSKLFGDGSRFSPGLDHVVGSLLSQFGSGPTLQKMAPALAAASLTLSTKERFKLINVAEECLLDFLLSPSMNTGKEQVTHTDSLAARDLLKSWLIGSFEKRLLWSDIKEIAMKKHVIPLDSTYAKSDRRGLRRKVQKILVGIKKVSRAEVPQALLDEVKNLDEQSGAARAIEEVRDAKGRGLAHELAMAGEKALLKAFLGLSISDERVFFPKEQAGLDPLGLVIRFASEEIGLQVLDAYQEEFKARLREHLSSDKLLEAMQRGFWRLASKLVKLIDREELYRTDEEGNNFLHRFIQSSSPNALQSVAKIQERLQVVLDPVCFLTRNYAGQRPDDLYCKKLFARPRIKDK